MPSPTPERRLFADWLDNQGGNLIPALQELQTRFGYLPPAELVALSQHLQLPLSRVLGVATFYSQFTLTPRGPHVIRVCLGTACHVRGATQVLEELQRQIAETEPGLVSVEVVRCLGACALAPVVVAADGRYHGAMTPTKVGRLLQEVLGGNRA